ncbi:MAG: nuclear transport factor 2 family protein [Pseudomonadota bacterium]
MLAQVFVRIFLALTLLLPAVAPAQSLGDREAVLAVNTEFYRAFREADRPGMEIVWGHQEPISVVHPSGWAAEGRIHVMNTWWNLMQYPPNIHCDVQSVEFADGKALVRCLEQLNPGTIPMINVFHQEDGAWKMIFHGPVKDEATS